MPITLPALTRRAPLAASDTTAYRLLNRAGDGFPKGAVLQPPAGASVYLRPL